MTTRKKAKANKVRRCVVLESPYRGDNYTELLTNIAYAKAAVQDSLSRGEAPMVSHLLYTQDGILDDKIPSERTVGMNCGHSWIDKAEALVVYTDMGISDGMNMAIRLARRKGITIERRKVRT